MKMIFFLFALLGQCAYAQDSVNVLFIGNSFTYYHDMPQTLQKMLDERGLKFKIQQSTFPGATLSDHLTRVKNEGGCWRRALATEVPPTVSILLSQKWDIVVLQNGTYQLLVPESAKNNYEAALIKLDSIVKSRHARTVLYQPFSDNKYPTQICYPGDFISAQMPVKYHSFNTQINYCSDSFQNSAQEFDALKKECFKASQLINCDIADVGSAFERCKKQYTEIQLYEADNEHPSVAGSYLIACIFF
jgi:hypothetical protein